MPVSSKVCAALFGLWLASSVAVQGQPAPPTAAQTIVTPPDPTHTRYVLAKDIKWVADGALGELHAHLAGDSKKPGLWEGLTIWEPGHMAPPHFHAGDRHYYVASGTLWTGPNSARPFDQKKMYPLPAGSLITHEADTVRWHGAKIGTGSALLVVTGMGPEEY